MGKKILVCGGRNYNNRETVRRTLDRIKPAEIIHGAARGADTLAGEYARDRGIPCRSFPADWQRHGRPAGFIRNRQMLDEGKPELVVAFPGGPGTRNMVKIALERGFPVKTVDEAGKIRALGPKAKAG